jgi:hypothetical protein
MSALATDARACSERPDSLGMIIAANALIIMTTSMISINVNPRCFIIFLSSDHL